ncbi:16981_t:CDS:1, partial [Funneliformis geosporum]
VFDKIVLTNEFSFIRYISLTQSDWKSLKEIVIFLKQFARISTEMCASTYPTISLVYLMYNHLMDHTEKIIKDGKSSKSLVAAAK